MANVLPAVFRRVVGQRSLTYGNGTMRPATCIPDRVPGAGVRFKGWVGLLR